MISAIIYLIDTIIIGIFCYKVYSIGYGKKANNKFANYFFWATLFMTISYIKSAIIIPISAITNNNDLLFWADFVGRALFYTAAIFSVQAPLYKFFPKSKKIIIVSYIYGLIGIPLLIYQFYIRNAPTINDAGIVIWNPDIFLTIGMGIMLILPWVLTSFIFIREYIKSKFSLPKSLLIGLGFFTVCAGAIFQDAAVTVFWYVSFSIPLMVGFIMILTGLFYENE